MADEVVYVVMDNSDYYGPDFCVVAATPEAAQAWIERRLVEDKYARRDHFEVWTEHLHQSGEQGRQQ